MAHQGVSLCRDANVLELDRDDGCTTLWMYCDWLVHFKMVNFVLCGFHLNKFFNKKEKIIYCTGKNIESYKVLLLKKTCKIS